MSNRDPKRTPRAKQKAINLRQARALKYGKPRRTR